MGEEIKENEEKMPIEEPYICISIKNDLNDIDPIPEIKLFNDINEAKIISVGKGEGNDTEIRINIDDPYAKNLSENNFCISNKPNEFSYSIYDPEPKNNYPSSAIRFKLIPNKKYKIIADETKLILGDKIVLTIVTNEELGFFDAKFEGIYKEPLIEPLCGYHVRLGRGDSDTIQVADINSTNQISANHLKLDYVKESEFTVSDIGKDGIGSKFGTTMIIGNADNPFIVDDYHINSYVFQIGESGPGYNYNYYLLIMDKSKRPTIKAE